MVKSRPASPLQVVDEEQLEYQTLYKQLQLDFDVFRKEVGTDSKMLKTQADQLAKEKSELSIQVAKLNTQLDYQRERYEIIVQNSELSNKENTQLRDRIGQLSQTIVRQDAKLEELTAKIIEYRDQAEQIKAENRQLTASKSSLQSTETRLAQENASLLTEKNRAQSLLKDSHRMFEELEKSSREEKKRLNDRVDRLDREL